MTRDSAHGQRTHSALRVDEDCDFTAEQPRRRIVVAAPTVPKGKFACDLVFYVDLVSELLDKGGTWTPSGLVHLLTSADCQERGAWSGDFVGKPTGFAKAVESELVPDVLVALRERGYLFSPCPGFEGIADNVFISKEPLD